MTRTIGIVACSAEGAALCYRTICVEGAGLFGPHAHPEIIMHTYPLSRYMPGIESGDWAAVAELMLSSAEILARGGADFLICPDNTIHQAFNRVMARSPLPWLHIAEEAAKEARRLGAQCVGVTGTKFLMEGPVYPEKLSAQGMECMIPPRRDRERINQIIFDELVYGRFLDESRRYFSEVIHALQERGCDAVVLGCTEIPLLIEQEHSCLPVLDSTRLLARAALRNAV